MPEFDSASESLVGEAAWEKAKTAVAQSMHAAYFERWIAPLRFVHCRDDKAIIGCPNIFFKEWVENHHFATLQEALQQAAGLEVRLGFEVVGANEGIPSQKPAKQLNFAQLSASPLWESGLNGNYTFQRFVVGPCNEFAYTASLEVARNQNTRYNPFLLLGDVGLGKSHLSSAIGNHVLKNGQQERVCYTTAEEFINEMIRALKSKKLEHFKDKFRRQCDVLVLDGVHFLSGKAQTQVELSYTLDALANADKRIVLTSNTLPREIQDMEESLKSRLTSGLVVDIKPPDPPTRYRILQQKAKQEGMELSEEVTDYIARRISGNVRQLESVLIHLLAKASLFHRPVDLALACEVVQDLHPEQLLSVKPTIDVVQDCICRYFRLEKEVLLSRSRKKRVYYPRQVGMYLCRQHTDATLSTIGKAFQRDHTSVIHSIAVIQRKRQRDAATRNQLDFLEDQILRTPRF